MDLENNMVLEQHTIKKVVRGSCDYCGEDIYVGQEATAIYSDGIVSINCHKECFDDYVNEVRENYIVD